MRILLLDVETSPNSAFVWGLFNQNISIDKIIDSSELLCWAAKWYDESEIMFASRPGGKMKMLRRIHKLLSEADAVVHYNGNSFDIPVLNKEFLGAKLLPPAPYKNVDLCKVVQRKFRFPSSKLDYVCQALGLGAKEKHEGFKLWVDCMHNEVQAWKTMERYNRQDVKILEDLYVKLLPWIPSHPNHATFADAVCCPKCGSTSFQRRGTAKTVVFSYPRFQCTSCGAWFRGSKREPTERASRVVEVAS